MLGNQGKKTTTGEKSSQKEETYSYLAEDLLLLHPQHRKERDTNRIKDVSYNYHKKICYTLAVKCYWRLGAKLRVL